MRRPSPHILRAAFLVLAVLWFGSSLLGLRGHSLAHTTKPADLSQLIARVETNPRGEPEQNVLAHDPLPAQPTRKPLRKRAATPRPSRAPTAIPVPGAAVARAVRRDDL